MPTTVEEIEKEETSQEKKDELLLDSLEIKGYRCFEHLTIEKLGRVNLIVGKNNVGKTALLESLWIYTNHDDSDILHKIAFSRDEITNEKNMSHESLKEYNSAIRHLFTGRPSVPNSSLKREDFPYFILTQNGPGAASAINKILTSDEGYLKNSNGKKDEFSELMLNSSGNKVTVVYYLYESGSGMPVTSFVPRHNRKITNLYISSAGLGIDKQVEFWDTITLTPLEDEVIKGLNLLIPKLKRIDFIGYPSGSKNRVPIIRVENEKERVPLKSFGEGLNRLLGISMALVQCQNGMLLIDEIESGLHYSVLPDVWKLIFKTAKDLNVQVFATTHSKDCIEAFAQAAYDSPEEGMLIRLERQGEKIVAKTIEEEMLVDAVNYEVEVR